MTEAAAVAHEKSNPIADLVAWITLLDAWSLISIALMVLCVTWIFWRLQKGNSRFNFGDAFIDYTTGQTSYLRIIIFGSFISSWLIVFNYVVRGVDIPPGMLTAIGTINGVFVVQMMFARGAEVVDPRVKAQAINQAPAMANQPQPQPGTPPVVGGDINVQVKAP